MKAQFIRVCSGCESEGDCYNVDIGAWRCEDVCALPSWLCGECVDNTISTCISTSHPSDSAVQHSEIAEQDSPSNTIDILSIVLFSFTTLFLLVVLINRFRRCAQGNRRREYKKATVNGPSYTTVDSQPTRSALGAF